MSLIGLHETEPITYELVINITSTVVHGNITNSLESCPNALFLYPKDRTKRKKNAKIEHGADSNQGGNLYTVG